MSDVIYKVLREEYLPVPTNEKWKQISKEYLDYRQIPQCLGSIDGKHIRIQKPEKGGSLWYNYKKFHSLHLMVSVDANYVFTIIDVGACGSANDNAVFRNSAFGESFFRNKLDIPKAEPLPSGGDPFPFFFVADEAFPLTPSLMRPFAAKNLKKSGSDNAERNKKEIFNYRISRARLNVECAFGILRSKFRIYDTPMLTDVPNTVKTVKATCVLHNFIRLEDRPHVNESEISQEFRATYQTRKNLTPLSVQTLNCGTHSYDAAAVRNNLADYFISDRGKVSWQNYKIRPTNFI